MKPALLIATCVLAIAGTACTSTSSGPPAPPKHASPELAARYNTQLAYGYMREGHMDVAQQKLAQAVAEAPQLASVHNALAFYYEQVGNVADADQQYKLSLQYAPDDPNTLNNYGAFLCRNGQYRDSLTYFARAAGDLNYDTPDAALTNAGVCALKIPDNALARQYFQRALAINSQAFQALWQLGLLSFEQGDYTSANSYLSRLIETEPNVPAYALWTAIEAAWAQGDRTDVERYGRQLLQRYPDSPEAGKYRAMSGNTQ